MAHPHAGSPNQCRDRGVASLGQVCKVHSVHSEIKKIYNLGGIQGWAKAVACTRQGCLLCEGHQGPPSPESWGPWSSTGRGTGGPRWSGSLALGTLPVRQEQPPGFLLGAQGQGGSSLWVWASTAPTEGWSRSKPCPYESSPRISFTKAAMSVFLVLCEVKKGCS